MLGIATNEELANLNEIPLRDDCEDECFLNCDLSDLFELCLEDRIKELENPQ